LKAGRGDRTIRCLDIRRGIAGSPTTGGKVTWRSFRYDEWPNVVSKRSPLVLLRYATLYHSVSAPPKATAARPTTARWRSFRYDEWPNVVSKRSPLVPLRHGNMISLGFCSGPQPQFTCLDSINNLLRSIKDSLRYVCNPHGPQPLTWYIIMISYSRSDGYYRVVAVAVWNIYKTGTVQH
jgi:hypothetical protein